MEKYLKYTQKQFKKNFRFDLTFLKRLQGLIWQPPGTLRVVYGLLAINPPPPIQPSDPAQLKYK